MADNTGRRMFHEDIFAEDNEKFSWQPLSRTTSSLANEVVNYNVHAGRGKDSSNSPSSEEDSFYKIDSNSLKRSFRKRGSSSASDGNIAEDTSSSQRHSHVNVPHERVLPSIYDDDARSGSPSGIFEKKDLAFQSSFKKDFKNLQNRSFGNSALYAELDAVRTIPTQDHDDYSKDRNNSNRSSPYDDLKESSEKSKDYRSRSQSRSKEVGCLRSKSRSASREGRNGSQNCSREKRSERYSKNQKSPSLGKRSCSPDSRIRSRSPDSKRRIHSPDRKNTRSPNSRRRTRSPDSKLRTRSPDRKRTRSPDSRRRTRSPDTRRRTRSPDTLRRARSPVSRRRSRSPGSQRRSRSRDSRRRSDSRHIRKRSRSRSYERRRRSRRSSSRDRYRRRRYSRSRSHSRDRGSSNRKPGSLPLSTSGGAMTPQMALQQTMAAMSAKAQAMTGIALPKYYNPAAVNPLKYAEQVQKRKLLWQTKEKEDEQPKNTVWDKLTFDQDQDGKMTAKFRKLMGIKSEGAGDTPESEKELVLKKQAELFRDLDQQYEMARVTTHTQRGVGLGYSATTLYPPIQK